MFKSIKKMPLYQRIIHPMNWFMNHLPTDPNHIKLTRKRIYIIPSRLGYILGAIIMVLLLASMNYSASLGFMLTFILASMTMIIMLHTFRNLRHLHLKIGTAKNVFWGEHILFPITLSSQNNNHYYSLQISAKKYQSDYINIQAHSKVISNISLLGNKRGEIAFPQFRVFTTFPFGIFYSWSLISPTTKALVYPAPSKKNIALPASSETSNTDSIGSKVKKGTDDFYGMRNYQKGDSYKNIAWKSYAKGQTLQSKEFVSQTTSDLWLDEHLISFMPIEHKLSQLCQWVLDAHKQGLSYGLKLKTGEIVPNKGLKHHQKCLEALAKYPRA